MTDLEIFHNSKTEKKVNEQNEQTDRKFWPKFQKLETYSPKGIRYK